MRKLISKITAAFFCACVASCSFLEEIPTTSMVSENVYVNESSAQAALQGCYKHLFYISHSSFLQYIQGCSILQHNGTTLQDYWFQHTLYSNNSYNATFYKYCFEAIAHYATFIHDVRKSPLDENTKVQMEAEARFLRAFYYFYATRLWGDLPLILDKLGTIEEAFVPRSPYQEVYKVILDDLDFAEKNLKPYEQLSDTEHMEGHVCNYSATALKAKVYVQIASYMSSPDDQWFDISREGRYPDFSNCGIAKDDVEGAWRLALEAAEDVILNGPFELERDYANLFRFEPEEHPEDYLSRERIVVIPITVMVGSCTYSSWSLPKQPWGSAQTTTDNGNKLKVRPTRFTWEKWCEKYGGDAYLVERGGNTIGPYHFYSGCPDPRLEATYFHTDYYTGYEPDDNMTENHCYPYANGEGSSNYVAYYDGSTLNTYSNIQNSTPIYKKGYSRAYRGAGSGGNADIYLFRYADVLLLAAEAAASLCSDANDAYGQKAISYVNQVLTRARKSTNANVNYPHYYNGISEAAAPANWNPADYPSKDELVLAVMWERFFEMDYEFQHLFDTRRRGANYYVQNFVRPFNVFMRTNANIRLTESPAMKYGMEKQEDIQKVRAGLLMAYPEYEILNNTAIDFATGQNDFYLQ